MELGATMVLKDNSNVSGFLKDIGNEMPRLAIDALGGEAGKRLAIALRPGGTLVVHSLAHGQVPQLSPSLIMYQQISMHGFNLPQWVADNGPESYLAMLESISELVQAEKLNVFTRTLSVDNLTQAALMKALTSHKLVQDGKSFRERTVLQFGDEASANEMYFELQVRLLDCMCTCRSLSSRGTSWPACIASQTWADVLVCQCHRPPSVSSTPTWVRTSPPLRSRWHRRQPRPCGRLARSPLPSRKHRLGGRTLQRCSRSLSSSSTFSSSRRRR